MSTVYAQRTDSYFYHSSLTANKQVFYSGILDTASSGNYDIVFGVKNDSGKSVWSKVFGGGSKELTNKLIPGKNNVQFYILGNTTSYGFGVRDIFLLKVDTMGVVSSIAFGESAMDDAYNAYILDNNEKVLLLGATETGVNNYDPILVELDTSLNILSAKTYLLPGDDHCNSICQAGKSQILAGKTTFGAGDGKDMLVCKTDTGFGMKWCKVIYNSDDQEINDVAVDSFGNIYLVGYAYNSWYNGVVIKLDSSGNILWQKRYESTISNKFLRVELVDNELWIGGVVSSISGSKDDFLFCKMDTSGGVIDAFEFNFENDEYLTRIQRIDTSVFFTGPSLGSSGWGYLLLKLNSNIDSVCNQVPVSLAIYNTSYQDSLLTASVDTFDYQISNTAMISDIVDSGFTFTLCFAGVEDTSTNPVDTTKDTTGVIEKLQPQRVTVKQVGQMLEIHNPQKLTYTYLIVDNIGRVLERVTYSKEKEFVSIDKPESSFLIIHYENQKVSYRIHSGYNR